MNVELLERVKAHILEEPKRLDMFDWVESADDLPRDLRPACGTVGCIAGWAVMLGTSDGSQPSRYQVVTTAGARLNLSADEEEGLFYVDQWPPAFATRYRRAKSPLGRARATADRIDHFIATNGKESL